LTVYCLVADELGEIRMQKQVYNRNRSDPAGKRTLQGTAQSRDETAPTTDLVFEVLYNRRRRDIITYLRENDGTATTSDLAEYIAAKENETTVAGLSSSERKCVYVGLYQNHLPMMDDAGVVDYEKDRGTVELRECVTQLEPYLDDDEPESSSYRITTGGAVSLVGVLLLGMFNVGVFAAIPDLLWATFGVLGMFVLALADVYGLYPLPNQ